VVTGSTDGIGKGYAKVLAKRGVSVFLISRSEEKLKSTADEITKTNPNVEVKTLAIDFQKVTPAVYSTTISDALKGLEIGILVNNVGMSYACPTELMEITDGDEVLQNLVQVNCTSVLQMTRVVLPSMLARKKGAVITISSAASFTPIPLLTAYSASKIFADYVGRGLKGEYANSGVIFQVVHPLYVTTKLSGIKRASFWTPNADKYANCALNTLGVVDSTSGCLSHEIQRIGFKLMIAVLPAAKLLSNIRKENKKIRAKYLKKQENENKAK